VLCLQCHKQKEQIEQTRHGHLPAKPSDSASFSHNPSAPSPVVSCIPCHSLHGTPSASTGWPAVGWPIASTVGDTKGMAQPPSSPGSPAERKCLGCHKAGGPAPAPAIATHPDVLMRNTIAVDAPGFWPLFNERGQVDPNGRIACPTCHVPHGRPAPAGQIAASPTSAESMATPELPGGRAAAAWSLLRPYTTPNVCNTCHGSDAMRRFLYFHNPSQRKGPLSKEPLPIAAAGS
jgi:hypothetical protein